MRFHGLVRWIRPSYKNRSVRPVDSKEPRSNAMPTRSDVPPAPGIIPRDSGGWHLAQRLRTPTWTGMGLLRLGAGGIIGGHALFYKATSSHPAPYYVQPIALVLASVICALAVAQLRWRTSRTLALASAACDVVVATSLLFLYAFDPRRYMFAIVMPVGAEAAMVLGLAGGLGVWAAMSAAYVASETIATSFYDAPSSSAAVAVRLSASLFVVLVTGVLLQAIEREKKWFMSLLEAAPDAVIVTDHRGRIVTVNRQVERTFGYPRGELLGGPIDMLIPEPLGPEHAYHPAEPAVKQGEQPAGAGFDLVGRRRDGTEFPAEISLSSLSNGDGFVTRIIRDVTEQRDAAEVLAKREQRFRALIENSSDWVMLIGPDAKVSYAGPSMERALGYTDADILGRSAFEWVHPEDHDRVMRVLSESVHTPGSEASAELRVRHRDGSWRWIEAAARNMLHDPAIGSVVVNSRDITERKEAEDAVRESEAKYRTLVENVPGAVYVWELGPGGRALYVSPQAERIHGHRREELLSGTLSWDDVIHPEDRERVLSADDEAEETGHYDIEYRVIAADGATVWVHDTAAVLSDQAGNARFWQGMLLDITERKGAEAALLEAEAKYRALVERLPAIVYLAEFGPDGAWLYVSPQVERVLGYSTEEWMTHEAPLGTFAHPDDIDRIRTVEAHSEKTGDPFGLEYRLRARDGRWVWILDEGITVRDRDGHPLYIQGVMYDITERKRAEEELRESYDALRKTDKQRRKLLALLTDAQEEERRRLAGDLHDDSIQKMTAVGMRLAALKARLPEDQRGSFTQLSEAVSLAVGRLRHLLFELHPPALDSGGLEAALREYLEEASEEGGPRFSIESRLAEELPPAIRTIAYRITQEVLVNARKHARAANVDVSLESRTGGLLVTVSDDGVGFDVAEAGDPRPGHLGLRSMRERAELAGGYLRVESTPGRGTTVRLWLPWAGRADGDLSAT